MAHRVQVGTTSDGKSVTAYASLQPNGIGHLHVRIGRKTVSRHEGSSICDGYVSGQPSSEDVAYWRSLAERELGPLSGEMGKIVFCDDREYPPAYMASMYGNEPGYTPQS